MRGEGLEQKQKKVKTQNVQRRKARRDSSKRASPSIFMPTKLKKRLPLALSRGEGPFLRAKVHQKCGCELESPASLIRDIQRQLDGA